MKSFITTSLLMLAALTQMSCSKQNDAGAEIAIAVTPDSALIVPGKGVSCVAQAEAKADDSTPTPDIEGNRVTFSRFALQWRSPDRLTIASIKATIFSSGITGAESTDGMEVVLDEAEIAALLGLSNLTIAYASPFPATEQAIQDYAINVDSTSSKSGTPYAACGLQIGGLGSVTGVKSYSARIKIELEGFATKCNQTTVNGAITCTDGEQRPVRQSVTVRAQKY